MQHHVRKEIVNRLEEYLQLISNFCLNKSLSIYLLESFYNTFNTLEQIIGRFDHYFNI